MKNSGQQGWGDWRQDELGEGQELGASYLNPGTYRAASLAWIIPTEAVRAFVEKVDAHPLHKAALWPRASCVQAGEALISPFQPHPYPVSWDISAPNCGFLMPRLRRVWVRARNLSVFSIRMTAPLFSQQNDTSTWKKGKRVSRVGSGSFVESYHFFFL